MRHQQVVMEFQKNIPQTKKYIKLEYPYALTKYLGEELIRHWHKIYKMPIASMDFLMFMDKDLEHQVFGEQFLDF